MVQCYVGGAQTLDFKEALLRWKIDQALRWSDGDLSAAVELLVSAESPEPDRQLVAMPSRRPWVMANLSREEVYLDHLDPAERAWYEAYYKDQENRG